MSILKKKDGKMVGCAFVQFSMKKEALKAIKECNMKPLLGNYVLYFLRLNHFTSEPVIPVSNGEALSKWQILIQ